MNKLDEIKWYQLSVGEIVKKLNTNIKDGLTNDKVRVRNNKYGKNIIVGNKKDTIFDKILNQVKSPLVFILLIAGVGAFFLGERVDATVIFLAVLINVAIGVFQENRASLAFEKLVESQEKYATVTRRGKKISIKSEELVVGDIVHVSAGMYIPADIRIIKENNLSVNESALTGEWVNVSKTASTIKKDEPITGQTNMLWMGTLVSVGVADGIVVEISGDTQIGKVAKNLLYEEDARTPLQKSIKKIAGFLAKFTLATVLLILLIGVFRGESFSDMLLVSIALAVAVMPEGMPVALTVVLALGMEAILKKGGLVRNLLAAETLGSTTVILTDKTGTLTYADMRVRGIITPSSVWETGKKENLIEVDKISLLKMAILTSDAFVEGNESLKSKLIIRGRPVEKAIILAGLDIGIYKEELLKDYREVNFFPFESSRRFVASLNETKKSTTNRLNLSGAPEMLLENASFYMSEGKKIKLSDKKRVELFAIQKKEGEKGMRLIGVAYKDVKASQIFGKSSEDTKEMIASTVFAGFIVLHDPIREDVRDSIFIVKEAGARVIMLTGDNQETATKIAVEAGIKKKSSIVLTGSDIEKYTDEELLASLDITDVFARVLPEQKLRIARVLKANGEVVAMTGDGINDAPALRSANIGISLGSGTEVAKEASDVVLINNSFSIIVDAIEEGRRILDNLKKIVVYLLSTGFSEIFVVTSALLAGAQLPLLPVQILWVNILQEGFMNFAYAFEPKETGIMERDPKNTAMKNLLTPNLKKLIFLIAMITGIFLVGLYFYLLNINMPIDRIRTFMFIALSVSSIFFALSIKNLHKPIWEINIFSNKYLLYSLSLSFFMLIISLTFSPLQKLLSLTTPSLAEFILVVALGIFNIIVIEAVKYIIFRRKNLSI